MHANTEPNSGDLYEYVLHVGSRTLACGIAHVPWRAEHYVARALLAQPPDAAPWGEVLLVERDYSQTIASYRRLARRSVCKLDGPGIVRWS